MALAASELIIGIVGPHDLVERIMLPGAPGRRSAASRAPGGRPPRRLVAAACTGERDAADQAARLGPQIDVCLFASRVAYDYARGAGVLSCPATFVPLGASVLATAAARASRDGADPARSSIDVLSRADAEEAFAGLGLPAAGVHVREESGTPAAVAAFHERLWHRAQTSVAFTGMESVAARLPAAGVPVYLLRPTGGAIRCAVEHAALLGENRRLAQSQLMLALVEVPALAGGARSTPRPQREELRLTVHRFLVQQAQQIGATVSPAGDHGFLIAATRGSLATAGDGSGQLPFTDRARRDLGVTLRVGIGTGATAAEAEASARASLRQPAAVARAGLAPARPGYAQVPAPGPPGAAARRLRGLQTLSRLDAGLARTDDGLSVDAETAGQALAVTPRTARRLLQTLVAEGLAWPLPPARMPQPGRPRQFYRLAVEQLDQPDDEPGHPAAR